MFNKVILIGNLTRDPELRYTPQGTAVAKFGIATNRKYGEGKEETYFGDVTVWGKQAENCSKYLSKGSRVLVEGRLVTEKWERDGKSHSKTAITAEKVQFLTFKPKEEQKEQSDEAQPEMPPEEISGLEPF